VKNSAKFLTQVPFEMLWCRNWATYRR